MSELRRDPITGRLVIIAPERRFLDPASRVPEPVGASDGDRCPFCEGQEELAGRELLAWRAPGTLANGPGWQVRVVANREPALRVEDHRGEDNGALFQAFGGLGAHEVIIESPTHRATFATMTADEIARVLWAWRERMRDLRRDIRLKSFLIVKNVGARAGATLDHGHSQLLALPMVPSHLDEELQGAQDYHARTTRCVFCDIVAGEMASGARVVAVDEHAIAFAPFASRVPFETWIMPREHQVKFEEVSDALLTVLGERLRDVMARLDTVLVSPPYSLLLHSAPVDADPASYHWHLEVIPRLGQVNGLAWDGGVHINPVAPERAGELLRTVR